MGNMSPRTAELYNGNLKSSRKNFKINDEVKDLINNYKVGDSKQLNEILEVAKKHDDMSYEFRVFRTFAAYNIIINNEDYTHDLGNKKSMIIDEHIKLNNSILLNKNSVSSIKRKKAMTASMYAYKATGDEKYNMKDNTLTDIQVVNPC